MFKLIAGLLKGVLGEERAFSWGEAAISTCPRSMNTSTAGEVIILRKPGSLNQK